MTPIALYKALGEEIEEFLEKKRPGQMNVEINFTPQGIGDCFIQEPRKKLKESGKGKIEDPFLRNIKRIAHQENCNHSRDGGP